MSLVTDKTSLNCRYLYLWDELDIVPLKDRTRGIDVKETMMAEFVKANYSKSVKAEA